MPPKSKSGAAKKAKKAGHRSWGSGNRPLVGGHRGDIMSPQTRSALMSRIKATGTAPERYIVEELKSRHLVFEQHCRDLPGRPDVVFREIRLAVFIDGDFWHGWRFPLWKNKLSDTWRKKIAANRARDRRNFRSLRNNGWTVLRIWEHQIEQKPEKHIQHLLKIIAACTNRAS
jgi:DNA mismatch endonuclease (patch repair protein)